MLGFKLHTRKKGSKQKIKGGTKLAATKFTFTTKAGCKRIFAVSLCAILILSFCAQLISSNWGKVKVTDITLDIRGGSLNGDLYYPSGTDANDSLPAIIVNHGGGVVKGVMKGISEELARRGFVVFNVNDYNQGLSDMPAVLEESTNPANGASLVDAINYLRTLKFVDATRIGMLGHSMGSRRVGLAAIQDAGCYSLNDLLLNELYDSFGVTISAEEVNTPADEIAEAQLDAEQLEYYQHRKAELTEYYNTRVAAVCLIGSNADLITSLQTVEVAGHEVQRNYQTNIGIVDGDFDVDYYTYPSMDFARESWYTGEEDILVDQYYLLDDATQTSQALWDFHANYYGDEAFSDAVSQRMLRSITFNPETHSKNFFSLASSTDVSRFFTNVFQYNCGELSTAAGGIDVTQNVWQYRAVLNCLAMFAMIVMVLALYGWLTKDTESYLLIRRCCGRRGAGSCEQEGLLGRHHSGRHHHLCGHLYSWRSRKGRLCASGNACWLAAIPPDVHGGIYLSIPSMAHPIRRDPGSHLHDLREKGHRNLWPEKAEYCHQHQVDPQKPACDRGGGHCGLHFPFRHPVPVQPGLSFLGIVLYEDEGGELGHCPTLCHPIPAHLPGHRLHDQLHAAYGLA